MKRTPLAVFGILTITAALATQVHAQSFLTNGLVAYWPFTGNANDASGNGINGTIYGATLTTNQVGTPNAAYYFDGISAYITAPLSNTVFGGDFTASMWYNAFDYADGWPTLVDADNGDGTYAFTLAIIGQKSGATAIGSLDASANSAPGPGNACYNAYTPSPAPLNTWNQAVITKAGTTVTMYLNDQVVTNAPIGRSIPTSAQFITIGRSDVAVYSGAWAFHGIIDDVRIYNVALSSNQVQQLYAFESQPIVSLKKAVKPAFANLFLGTNYQLQVSTDLSTWTNSGSAFTATNTSMVYPQYFDVDDWNQLFFRLQAGP
ncbi:MAG: LamG domain-containing protein [Limisphaerales bacterium]